MLAFIGTDEVAFGMVVVPVVSTSTISLDLGKLSSGSFPKMRTAILREKFILPDAVSKEGFS